MTVVEVLGEIAMVETIAVGRAIHDIRRLRRDHGPGRWRKLKGIATVRLMDETVARAEIHWYEAHGIGRRDVKVKRVLD